MQHQSSENSEKPKLYVIAGPTAVGKSAVAVRLAKLIDGEVISADSIQVYRGMDIGSAKITKEEMQGVPHHLIDILDIHDEYNVARFKDMAKTAVKGIYGRGRIPIICGGTGFYVQSVIYDIDFENEDHLKSAEIKNKLEEDLKNYGEAKLINMLKEKDPYTYSCIDLSNTKRVIRALSYFLLHGESIQLNNEKEAEKRKNPPYDLKYFVLYGSQKKMYERIDNRVDKMIENGLYDEVKRLIDKGLKKEDQSAQGIGYREMICAVTEGTDITETAEKIKLNTRHFAKRQLTWFKREPNTVWINIDEGDPLDEIRKHI